MFDPLKRSSTRYAFAGAWHYPPAIRARAHDRGEDRGVVPSSPEKDDQMRNTHLLS